MEYHTIGKNYQLYGFKEVNRELEIINYAVMRMKLKRQLEEFVDTDYDLADLGLAEQDMRRLNALKLQLQAKKREIESQAKQPVATALAQMDELIAMVRQPLREVEQYIHTVKKDDKTRRIYAYARVKAQRLGKYGPAVVESSSFFNPSWRNLTCAEEEWKRDVNRIIESAQADIKKIQSLGSENEGAMLAFYIDKLSFRGIDKFLDNMKLVESGDEARGKISGAAGTTDPFIIARLTGNLDVINGYMKGIESKGIKVEVLKEDYGLVRTEIKNREFLAVNGGTVRAGSVWDAYEDQQLIQEFKEGYILSDIAKMHGRTPYAIKARLAKYNLIELEEIPAKR